MGVSFHKKVKTDKWKADIVVDYQNYKVAFNVCKNPRNIEETYTTYCCQYIANDNNLKYE